jgi:hypothetical protein
VEDNAAATMAMDRPTRKIEGILDFRFRFWIETMKRMPTSGLTWRWEFTIQAFGAAAPAQSKIQNRKSKIPLVLKQKLIGVQ